MGPEGASREDVQPFQGVPDQMSGGDASGYLEITELSGQGGKLAQKGAVRGGDGEVEKIPDRAIDECVGLPH